MGTVYDDLPDHEGYGLCVGADSSDRADARTFAAYQAACECGWRGRVLHPPSDDGYDAAVDEWDRGHARPLLEQAVLDQSIARLSFTPFRKLDMEVLTALRMGVYQKQFLSKVPAHAAVNETVELVKQASWSATRNALLNNELDAAHCLFSLPLSVAMGIGGAAATNMLKVAMILNQNGQAITLKQDWADAGYDKHYLIDITPHVVAPIHRETLELYRRDVGIVPPW